MKIITRNRYLEIGLKAVFDSKKIGALTMSDCALYDMGNGSICLVADLPAPDSDSVSQTLFILQHRVAMFNLNKKSCVDIEYYLEGVFKTSDTIFVKNKRTLSLKEDFIFRLIIEGYSVNAISKKLQINNKTVFTVKYKALGKLGVSSIAEFIIIMNTLESSANFHGGDF